MADLLQTVRPGDLITADYMNTVIEALNALEERVSDLEDQMADNNQVIITQLIPSGSSNDPIREGSELKILGRNFGFSTGAQRVYFNSTRIDSYKPGTSDQQLVIDVPDLNIQNQNGEAYNLSVSNGISTATRSIVVYPREQTFQGNVDVIWSTNVDSNPDPNPIVRQKPAVFYYDIKSRATMAADVQIVPTITEFQSTLQVLDTSNTPLENNTIHLPAGEQTGFAVQIDSVPAGAPDTFTLQVQAQVGGKTVGSFQKDFTIGQDVIPPDDNITLNVSGFVPSDNYDGTTITLSPGEVGTMTLNADFQMPDVSPPVDYNLLVTVTPADANWQAQLPNEQSSPITEDETDYGGGVAQESLKFQVMPAQTGASQSAKVTFTVQQKGETKVRSLDFPLSLG